MPTSLPVRTSHAARQKAVRRLPLGWSWADWALFLAAYLVIAGAVVFAAPEGRQAASTSHAIAVEAR